uniref:SHSP domain-containing protein n=1 Tax=Odontella aurita TaxID=265563 RepID=A0A7S4HWL5_9STRA|mmetsp:Transcript_16324/g.47004  ORF Transcript_16324/g.47004 Transcript_16324/m.47004 type:complete len:174 (+) Transcript_16324:241-762(+)
MSSGREQKNDDHHRSLIFVPPTRDLFRGFDDWFSGDKLSNAPSLLPSLFAHAGRRDNKLLRRSSPFYEISENGEQCQLAVDVPGVKAQDMNVQLDHGGRMLRLWGGRKVIRGDTTSETKFEKCFTIDQSVDTDRIMANLADGVLVVTVPKNPHHVDNKNIPIVQGPPPTLLKE